jgi:hypothetical protein
MVNYHYKNKGVYMGTKEILMRENKLLKEQVQKLRLENKEINNKYETLKKRYKNQNKELLSYKLEKIHNEN